MAAYMLGCERQDTKKLDGRGVRVESTERRRVVYDANILTVANSMIEALDDAVK